MVRRQRRPRLATLKPAGGEVALADAYRAGARDAMYQARAAALGALAKYGAAAAGPVLKEALTDSDWAVRVKASALLRELDPATDLSATIRPAPSSAADRLLVFVAGRADRSSPHVFLETDKGTIEIELAVLDAPLTSANFLALARSGAFSGVAIHRVVANFVVQDGDTRGDGEGQPGLHDSRRAEQAPVPARHRRHGARLAGHRRQPVLHHALAAAASRWTLHRVRPRRGGHGVRGSPAAVGRHPTRADVGWCGADGEVKPRLRSGRTASYGGSWRAMKRVRTPEKQRGRQPPPRVHD